MLGKDVVKHWKVLHRDASTGKWKEEPHAEVRATGKVKEEGEEALMIGIDPDSLLDGSLDVETLFELEVYIALQLEVESVETENKVINIDPDFQTTVTKKELESNSYLKIENLKEKEENKPQKLGQRCDREPFVLCSLTFVLYPLSIVHSQLSIDQCPLSIVICPLFFVLYSWSFVLCFCPLSSFLCPLLFVHCP